MKRHSVGSQEILQVFELGGRPHLSQAPNLTQFPPALPQRVQALVGQVAVDVAPHAFAEGQRQHLAAANAAGPSHRVPRRSILGDLFGRHTQLATGTPSGVAGVASVAGVADVASVRDPHVGQTASVSGEHAQVTRCPTLNYETVFPRHAERSMTETSRLVQVSGLA